MRKALLFAVLVLIALSPASAAALEWASIVEEEEAYCVGASADGSRVLVAKSGDFIGPGALFRPCIVDADGRRETGLFFSASTDAESLSQVLRETLRLSDEAFAGMLSKYRGAAGFSMIGLPWHTAQQAEAAGDLLLMRMQGGLYMALVNASTGETAVLDGVSATLTRDGRAVVIDVSGGVSVYDPANGTYAPVPRADGEEYTIRAARRLSDGGFVCSRRPPLGSADRNGLAFLDAGGAVTKEMKTCAYKLGAAPDALIYSEELGVGIAFNTGYIMKSPALIFRRDGDVARVLWLDGADEARAREVEIDEVLSAEGELAVDAPCMLLPVGLSGDGRSALVLEMKSVSLIAIDLETLDARVVADDGGMAELFREKQLKYQHLTTVSCLRWNGGSLLIGRTCAPGCVIDIGRD